MVKYSFLIGVVGVNSYFFGLDFYFYTRHSATGKTDLLGQDFYVTIRGCLQFYYLGQNAAILCAPTLTYLVYAPFRGSKITAFCFKRANYKQPLI
jgi:hypothetical protein